MAQTSNSTCQSCGEREATILFTRIHVDEKETLQLCAICAAPEAEEQSQAQGPSAPVPEESAAAGESTPAESEKAESGQEAEEFTSDDPPQKVAEVNVVIGHLSKKEKGASSNACPRCGMTYERFRKHGRFGCSDCYATFSSELERLFKRIHGFQQHAGKAPAEKGTPMAEAAPVPDPSGLAPEAGAEKGAAILSEPAVQELQDELERAVTDEDYERAAELRDRIAQLDHEESGG